MVLDPKISKTVYEAQECLRHAVYDAMVERAKNDLFAIISRNNKPYKIKASKAVRLIQEGRVERGESPCE